VQCRADDETTRALLNSIDHAPSHRALRAERAVLAGLGGSCTVPVGAWAQSADSIPDSPVHSPLHSPSDSSSLDSSSLDVHGLVASGDGRVVIRMSHRGDDPERVGSELAQMLLVEGGGSGIEGFDEAALSGRGAPDRMQPT
jgi:porphobilinogen deaminase